jgi:hypothetical protein
MTQKNESILDDDRNYIYNPVLVVEESSAGRSSAPSSDQQPDLIQYADAEPILPSGPAEPYSRSISGSSSSSSSSCTGTIAGQPIDITESVPAGQKHLVAPAGIGAAILGFILGGPILSALLGFSSAYIVRKDGTVGDVARSVGEVTLSVQDTATTIEEKHGFFSRTKKVVDDWTGDEKRSNRLAFQARSAIVSSCTTVAEYTRKHQLLERGVETTGQGIEYVTNALTRSTKQEK